jgi:hypothetical protein
MRLSHRSLCLFAIILTFTPLPGCWSKSTGRAGGSVKNKIAHGEQIVIDREVKYSLDGNGKANFVGELATIDFSEGKVVVEKNRILFNDKEVAKVPEATKLVAVDYTDGLLTITADGAKVHEGRLKK